MEVVADANGGCGECSHGVLPFYFDVEPERSMRQKSASGGETTLLCSRRELQLSIEMNAKMEDSSGNLIEFRDVSFRINDILNRLIVLGVSLEIPQGETLVLLVRCVCGKPTRLRLIIARL